MQGQRGLNTPVNRQIDLILAILLKFKILHVQNEIDYGGWSIIANPDGDAAFQFGADGIAVGIDDENLDGVVAGFNL